MWASKTTFWEKDHQTPGHLEKRPPFANLQQIVSADRARPLRHGTWTLRFFLQEMAGAAPGKAEEDGNEFRLAGVWRRAERTRRVRMPVRHPVGLLTCSVLCSRLYAQTSRQALAVSAAPRAPGPVRRGVCAFAGAECVRARSGRASLMAARWPCREQQLRLYALFKQASVGACNTQRPGMLDFVGEKRAPVCVRVARSAAVRLTRRWGVSAGRAKWDAWNALDPALSSSDARAQYVIALPVPTPPQSACRPPAHASSIHPKPPLPPPDLLSRRGLCVHWRTHGCRWTKCGECVLAGEQIRRLLPPRSPPKGAGTCEWSKSPVRPLTSHNCLWAPQLSVLCTGPCSVALCTGACSVAPLPPVPSPTRPHVRPHPPRLPTPRVRVHVHKDERTGGQQ